MVAACGGAPSATPRSSSIGASARPQSARPPERLCGHEIDHLQDGYAFSISAEDRAAVTPKNAKPRPVILDDALPKDVELAAVAFPNVAHLERVDRPRSGEIGRLDAAGARGAVVVVTRRKLSGGLYDYVGACETARAYLYALPRVDGAPITIHVGDSDAAITIDIDGNDASVEPMVE